MQVASLELCKELFELSGWDFENATHFCYYGLDGVPNIAFGKLGDVKTIPAYDLGYLLRKLSNRWWLKYRGTDYVAKWDNRKQEVLCEASTPEDAACKLAIELFKQGVLKHG